MTELEQAKANLKAYFDGLGPEARARALAFQKSLDQEAAKTEGGMTQVIVNRMRHNAALLEEALDDAREVHAALKTDEVLSKHRL